VALVKIAPSRSAPHDGQVSSTAGETTLQRRQITASSDSEYSGCIMRTRAGSGWRNARASHGIGITISKPNECARVLGARRFTDTVAYDSRGKKRIGSTVLRTFAQ